MTQYDHQDSFASIIEQLFKRELWTQHYDKIEYDLARYPNANISEKSVIAKAILSECFEGHELPYKVLIEFDDILGLAGKRRHFNHSFEIFLIGLMLISNNERIFKLSFVGFEKKKVTWKLLFETWLFIAAYHDIGYPLEQSAQIVGKISKMYSEIGIIKLAEKYNSINTKNILKTEDYLFRYYHCTADNHKLEVYDIEEIMADALSHTLSNRDRSISTKVVEQSKSSENHGFVSALFMVRNRINTLLSNNQFTSSEIQYDAMLKATGAVIIHSFSLKDVLLTKINIKQNPFAYLLTILDNIHDWDRNYDKSNNDYPEYILGDIKYKKDENVIDLQYIVKCLSDASIDEAAKFISSKKTLHNITSGKIGLKINVNYIINLMPTEDVTEAGLEVASKIDRSLILQV